ncbi:MAG TPA: hypothetical protein VFO04_01740 [Nitrospira sp.]|nr:hypothetical protein [Nitrospira sp.]
MKRILGACVAVAFGASVVPAASPPVDAAIKKIQAVVADAGKMKLFCDLNGALDSGEDKEDPAVEKKIDGIVTQLGPDFAAAWKVGDELDETSPDATEFAAAVEAIAEKCP